VHADIGRRALRRACGSGSRPTTRRC
jgi:hypothetical protein